MRTERELLIDCLDRPNRLRRAYMLVGSMASNFWGIPRTTHDLDFVVALIACEQTGRKAFLMELDPLYCDVIVQRWEKFTGGKADRVSLQEAVA